MNFTLIFLLMLLMVTLNTAAIDEFILRLKKLLPSSFNFFNQPTSVSSALLKTPTATTKPTVQQLWYYSYYGGVNCPTFVFDFNCTSCKQIKDDISKYKLVFNSETDLYSLVTVSDKRKEIVVAYRGSLLPKDFELDFTIATATPVEDSKIKIHKGFYTAAMSLYDEVKDTVRCQLAKTSTYKIVLTGVSLGGAIARITSFFFLYLKEFPNVPIEVYTYGEPRSGNQYYADFLNSQPITTIRVVSNSDIVPHLPPTSLFETTFFYDYYVHVVTEYWLNATNGGVYCDQSTYEDARCSNSIGPAYNPLDHSTFLGFSASQCISDAFKALPKFSSVSSKDNCGFAANLSLTLSFLP